MFFLKLLILIFVQRLFLVYGRSSEVHLIKNGYTGLVIGIHKNIPEDPKLIAAIKEKFTKASKQLYRSSRKRAYFNGITVLLPTTWTDKPEYGQVKTELYEKADVIIASPNPRHRNNPYVKTFKGCGQPGEHMHFTPDYMMNPKSEDMYGPTEKLIVHEWGHFRWGVFDEYPTEGEQEFYFSPRTGKLEATRCTFDMKGRIFEYVDLGGGRKGVKFCSPDPMTGRYPKDCHFYPHEKARWQRGLKASIMDRQYIEGVEHFCDHDKTDPKINHNSEAPNKHNRLCGGRSTWQVILESDDFKNGNNDPRDMADNELEPKFNIVRTRDRRVVMVMDTSGSMTTDDKLTRMTQTAEQYIRDGIEMNSELGIVEFNTAASMASPMRVIKSDTDRDILIRDIPNLVGGGTSIGGGLEKAMELLKAGGGNANGALILLITDGAENGFPRVIDVIPKLYLEGVTVDTLAFTYVADENTAAISEKTGGKFYYDSNDPKSTAMNDAFYEISTTGKDELERPLQVVSRADELLGGQALEGTFFIDTDIGRDTLVVCTYTNDNPVDVWLKSPLEIMYNNESIEYNITTDFKTIRFRFSNLEKGKWSYHVSNANDPADRTGYQRVTIAVTTKANTNSPPITVKAQLSSIKTEQLKAAVFAEVTKGSFPVLGMTVFATIDRPLANPYEVELLDNGLGADLTKDDGVYSRYFTAFTANGRYSVSVKLNNDKRTAIVKKSNVIGQAASFRVDADNPLKFIPPQVETTTTAVTTEVERTTTAGAFEFKMPGTFAPFQPLPELLKGNDIVPPGKISDLLVSRTSHEAGTVWLTWIATGDDEDTGTASKYDIRIASTYADFSNNIEGAHQVLQSQILTGNLSAPLHSGQQEYFTIKVNVNPNQNASYVFAVRAIDEVGQKAEFSNVVTAGLGYIPDVLIIEAIDPNVLKEMYTIKSQISNLTTSKLESSMRNTAEITNTKNTKPTITERNTTTDQLYRKTTLLASISKTETTSPRESTRSTKVTIQSMTSGDMPSASSLGTSFPGTGDTGETKNKKSAFDDPGILGLTIAACATGVLVTLVGIALLIARPKRGSSKVDTPAAWTEGDSSGRPSRMTPRCHSWVANDMELQHI